MESLFEATVTKPLAERMRPKKLSDFIGQENVVGKNSFLVKVINGDNIPSIIFYGPPGTGKTTLAKVIAKMSKSIFLSLNAVTAGVSDLKKIIQESKISLNSGFGKTIVFIDEIHRFNKAQQDVLLPFVENGTITLIGATTENPFFEINSPLLSRMKIIKLDLLDNESIKKIITKALRDEVNGFGEKKIRISESSLNILANLSGGDARVALNLLEQLVIMVEPNNFIDNEIIEKIIGNKILRYDKNGDYHYDTVSAFIKSMRGSDANAALHYLARMIESGETVRFIARRIVIFASEDIGNADPQALVIAQSAASAADFIGLPEAKLILAEAVCYMAEAPKSNSCFKAIIEATKDVKKGNLGSIPMHLRDAHYKGASKIGSGKGYLYPHDYPNSYIKQEYLPTNLKDKKYYLPKDVGYEKNILERRRLRGANFDK